MDDKATDTTAVVPVVSRQRRRRGVDNGHSPGRDAKVARARARSQVRFLTKFVQKGTITHAARGSGVSVSTHYTWLADPAYAQAFAMARVEATDELEREARRRAVEGTLRPVFQGGALVGKVREFSDVLLIFQLKANAPGKFRERATVEHTGPGGAPIQHSVSLAALTDDELEAMRILRMKMDGVSIEGTVAVVRQLAAPPDPSVVVEVVEEVAGA